MQVYIFVSSANPEVAGLTGSRTGDDLPTYLAPWLFRGSTFMPEGDPRPDAATIRAAIIQGRQCLVAARFFP
jgi:hypothetical protein